jgi:asparagine synthase (glutamine-hydrolysing)
MCGIFAAIDRTGYFQRSAAQGFVTLTDLVRYRGPDAAGQVSLQLKTGASPETFDVFLGHRRLSIIDVSAAGNQPFTNGAGLWIVFNGEIFNYVELREELKRRGHQFRTATDTEVILACYAEWGEAGFDQLNGMWAFVLVDVPRRQVIASRDRFSIKPLYRLQERDRVYFASEIKQLLPLLPRREINSAVMFSFLEQGLLDHTDATFYRGIVKIKPKTALIFSMDGAEARETVYWDYRPEPALSWDDAVERFRELLLDSVRLRLRSDVKLGALLSGGLDSSAISVLANRACGNTFETYSIIAAEPQFSEEPFIDLVRDRAGIRNTKLLFNPARMLEALDDVIYHADEPFGGFSVVAQYCILEQIRKQTDVVVVLSGQGGDEILMGYLKYFFFYLKNLLRSGRWLKAGSEAASSLLKRTVLRQFELGAAKRYMPFMQRSGAQQISRLQGEWEPVWASGDLCRRQKDDIDKYSVPALTHYEDRNSMAHSRETRLPFLDHRLVNFVVHLPEAMKLHGGWTKYILRCAMHEMPDPIRWRRDKQGFVIPEPLWLRHDLRPMICEAFRGSTLAALGVLDDAAFLQRYQRYREGDGRAATSEISRVLIAELWARKFLLGANTCAAAVH